MIASQFKSMPKNCPSCGAPVSTEYCPYCGTATGLSSSMADMQYPVMDCKEITANGEDMKFNVSLGGIFALIGAVLLAGDLLFWKTLMLSIIAGGFMVFGLWVAAKPLWVLFRVLWMKVFGKTVQAKVYGYLEDDMTINNRPAQIVKLLIKTDDGPRFILYQMGHTLKPYGIGDSIDVKLRGNRYMICNKP